MKKIAIGFLMLLAAFGLRAQSLTLTTNQVVSVKPLVLSAAKLNAIVAGVQSVGLGLGINSTNLQSLQVMRQTVRGTNGIVPVFVVRVILR